MKRSFLFLYLFISTVIPYTLPEIEARTESEQSKGDKTVKMQHKNSQEVKYFSGKDSVSAYMAVPDGNGPFPALILIHEWWGLNDWVKKNADDFADSGYVALAIDLYHGKSAASTDEARKLSGSVSQDAAGTDLRSAFDYLRNMKDVDKNRIGSIGWCMGGAYSLKAALGNPELGACVINYGRLVTDVETLKKINCPVLGIFGEKDQNITPDIVRAFEKSLNEADIKNKIIIYPGVGHAFMNPGNTNLYDESTTRKAWDETYSFLNNNLKRKGK